MTIIDVLEYRGRGVTAYGFIDADIINVGDDVHIGYSSDSDIIRKSVVLDILADGHQIHQVIKGTYCGLVLKDVNLQDIHTGMNITKKSELPEKSTKENISNDRDASLSSAPDISYSRDNLTKIKGDEVVIQSDEVRAKQDGISSRMTVTDVMEFTGHGVAAYGKIEDGAFHSGDKIVIIGNKFKLISVVTGILVNGHIADNAKHGEYCGLILRNTKVEDIKCGSTIINWVENFKITDSNSMDNSKINSQEFKLNIIDIMAIDKKKIEYVIGIDLGHGETSAAICPMQWDIPISQVNGVDDKDIELQGKAKVIPSIIAVKPNGNVMLGENAAELTDAEKIYVGFKKRPVDINGAAEQVMISFMRNVYRLIREKIGGDLTDTNHLVFIACPSGWNKSEQDLYFKMAQQAGIPIGGITPESKGAFIKATEEAQSTIKRNMGKGAIVVDMGSSTLDFTYLSLNGGTWIHDTFGYDCGASKVEEFLLKSYNDSDDLNRFREEYPEKMQRLLYEFRKHKEGIYNREGELYNKKLELEEICGEEDYGYIRIRHTSDSLHSILYECGYVDQIRRAMNDFKRDHIGGKPINGVLLTGGASRMNIIKDLVMECWGVSNNIISRDQDPSLTISRGVAIAARKELRSEDQANELEPLFRQIDGNAVYSKFNEIFGGYLYEQITDRVAQACNNWRDSNYNLSLNDLNRRINYAVENAVEESAEKINEGVQLALDEETKELREKVNSIVASYHSQGINISTPSIPNIEVMSGEDSSFDISGILEEISNSIETESSNWGGMIAGAGIGAAVALFFGGPLAWIIGGGALIGKWLFGEEETEEQKRMKAMSKDLDSNARQSVYDVLVEKWEDITDSIADSIRDSLNENEKARRNISVAVNKILQAYKESLQKSRIMFD